MKVRESDARELLVALGAKAASLNTVKRMETKLNSLSEWAADAEAPDDKPGELFDKILRNIEDGEKVTIVADDYDPDAEDEAPAPKGKGKGKGKAKPDKDEGKEPGVIDTIVELLLKANAKRPIDKDGMLDKLGERFPERSPEAMRKTVDTQVPSRLRAKKGYDVQKNEKGYWIAAK